MMLKFGAQIEKDYIPESERGADNPSVFRLRALSSLADSKIRDRTATVEGTEGNSQIQINTGTLALLTVQFGVVGWENVEGPDGKPLEFATQNEIIGGSKVPKLRGDLLQILPPGLIAELSDEIANLSRLGAGEEKNCESQPGSCSPDGSMISDAPAANPTPEIGLDASGE